MSVRGASAALGLLLGFAGCNDDKTKLEQQQHDQAVAASAAATQAEKDKGIASAQAVQAAAAAATQAEKVAAAAAAKALADEKAEQVQAEATKRADVLEHPEKYLLVRNFKQTTTGVIRHETQLTGMTVENNSPFPLTAISGDVRWVDDSGSPLGVTSQVMLAGPVQARATVGVSLDDGTIVQSGKVGGKGAVASVTLNRAIIWKPADAKGAWGGPPGEGPTNCGATTCPSGLRCCHAVLGHSAPEGNGGCWRPEMCTD